MRKNVAVAVAVVSALLIPISSAAASAAPVVRFSTVQYDSPGSDTGKNVSLNSEWVQITNHASTKRVLTGWTVRDPQGHVYRFPTYTLRAGHSVRVHTGSGTNSSTDLYWRASYYVWNNTGDKAILKSKAGTQIDTCSWGDGSGAIGC